MTDTTTAPAPAEATRAGRTGLRRQVWLYRRCLGAHLRSTLEYEKDFWVLSISALLTQGVGIVFLSAIFHSIPRFDGWGFWDVAMIYSLVALTEGVSVLLAQGAWSLAWTVNTGELDPLLLRPYAPVLQVLSSQIGMNGIGNVGVGGGLLIAALAHVDVDWSPGLAVLGLVLLAGAVVTKIGLNLATNAVAFWLKSPFSMFAFAMHTFGELTRFPLAIYGVAVRIALTVALPYAFMSYFPAVAFLQRGDLWRIGLATPVVAAYTLGMGVWLFNRGLRRYESSGQ